MMISLKEGEQMVKIVRQHGTVVSSPVIKGIVFCGLIIFAIFSFDLKFGQYLPHLTAGVIFLAALVILYKIYLWRKNVLIITDRRLILESKQSIFSRTVTELLYQDVYDISFKQSGLMSLMAHYGTIIIRTPSGNQIVFDRVSSPAKIIEIINETRSRVGH